MPETVELDGMAVNTATPLSPKQPPAMEAVREVIQIRLVIRRMLDEFGEAVVTAFFERMSSPLPTVDLIFKEELHKFWIRKGDIHRLPVDDEGNRLLAVPVPEWGIVHSNETTETIWTSSYATMLTKLSFVDLTVED